MKFIEIPATAKSIAKRSYVYGHGINDSNYLTNPKINGKTVTCPYYKKWAGMLERCYSKSYKEKNKTYKEATVCKEWLLFSNFKLWMMNQDWIGKELDKDLMVSGNKFYSPDTCVFLSPSINKILTDKNSSKGIYPNGVCLHKQTGKYRARSLNGHGKRVCLGLYQDSNTAFEAYKKFKLSVLRGLAEKEDEPIKSAILKVKITKGRYYA